MNVLDGLVAAYLAEVHRGNSAEHRMLTADAMDALQWHLDAAARHEANARDYPSGSHSREQELRAAAVRFAMAEHAEERARRMVVA